jgi:hypothetical protein
MGNGARPESDFVVFVGLVILVVVLIVVATCSRSQVSAL